MPVFDTAAAVRALKQAGFDERQAEAIVSVQRQALDGLATRQDLEVLEGRLKVFLLKTTFSAALDGIGG